MNEESMDKKKKNEDEKEVIDFMELVEENLSNIGSEKETNKSEDLIKNEDFINNENEDLIKKDLFENKPLQDIINNESEDLIFENEDLIKEKKDNLLNGEDNLVIENIIDQVNEEAEFIGSDEDFIVGRSSSELNEIITEEILEDLRKNILDGEDVLNDKQENIREDLEELNEHIKRMAVESVLEKKPSTNIILHKNDTLEVRNPFTKEDIRIYKYPGYLYINIYAIEKYFSADINVQSVFVRMEADDFIYETEDFSENSNIKMNSLVHLSLSTNKSFKLRFIMNKRTDKDVIKSCECSIDINKEFIDRIHNTLYEVNNEWSAYSSRNFVKNLFSFFTYSVADAYSLKLYFSFISEEEFKIIGIPIPNSLYDLGRWLKIRKHAYSTWFSGFCNLRGNVPNICTHLWKRRYIKIYGYKIYIFNEHTKNLMGIFNLVSTMTKERQIYEEDNKIKIVNSDNFIEFHFESSEKFKMFRDVLEALI